LIFSFVAGKVVEPATAQAYIGAEILELDAAASPETAVGDLVPEERLPLPYPDMPLDAAPLCALASPADSQSGAGSGGSRGAD
jgi:hypothetical protein